MNNFKKAALATSILGLVAIANDASATAVSATSPVIIGCTVPANTTAAATVYSVDAYDSDAAALTGLPSWLKAGASCSRAVNYMLTSVGAQLGTVTNQVANGGYTLQSFPFGVAGTGSSIAIAAGATVPVSMIGCAAPASGTAGATIYSVDGSNSAASTANTGITLTALSGNPCTSGLATVPGVRVTNAILNVRTADGAYSLEQYIVQ